MLHIYHIFDATASHLSVNLIEAIVKKSSYKHFFILIGEESKKYLYVNMFEKCKWKDYIYFNSFIDFKKSVILKKNDCILIHAGQYSWMLFFFLKRYSNVNWVCWGSGMVLGSTLRSKMSFFFKYVLYNYFYSIVVLMTPELDYAKKIYKIKNIFHIPYLGIMDDLYGFSEEKIKASLFYRNEDKIVVFLGNNFYSIPSYITMLDTLYHLKGKIEIHCMVNYSLDEYNECYVELCQKGKSMYGKDFVVHTEFYDLKDYPDFMNLCDVYICDMNKQTGLGAIHTCIRLGKKLYLAGNNYDYIKGQNYIVHSCDELNNITKEELVKYTLEERLFNFKNYQRLHDQKELLERWEKYYDFILCNF